MKTFLLAIIAATALAALNLLRYRTHGAGYEVYLPGYARRPFYPGD